MGDFLGVVLCVLMVLQLLTTSDASALPRIPKSDLTALSTSGLPSIPGFTATIQYDHSKPLDEWEIYLLLIQGMKAYGGLSWDARVGADPFPFSPPGLSIRLVARYFRPVQLSIKHIVMGLYEIGRDMVSQEPSSFFDTRATLSVLSRPIGDIQLQKRPSAGVSDDLRGNVTTASSTNKDVNSIDSPEPARGGETFSIVDIVLPSFRVSGKFTGKYIAVSRLFTASLNALAQAAVPDREEKGVHINAVSAGDRIYPYAFINILDIGGFFGTQMLSYNQAARAIVCLWRMFLEVKKYGGLEFIIEDSGERIGTGFIGTGFIDGRGVQGEASVASLK
ncbi:hypothetical protein G7Y79_00014g036760 [Physcia stellaris]|nr:hypothetical protein G7Y79_00014g036760 [Physcia stellaris]